MHNVNTWDLQDHTRQKVCYSLVPLPPRPSTFLDGERWEKLAAGKKMAWHCPWLATRWRCPLSKQKDFLLLVIPRSGCLQNPQGTFGFSLYHHHLPPAPFDGRVPLSSGPSVLFPCAAIFLYPETPTLAGDRSLSHSRLASLK